MSLHLAYPVHFFYSFAQTGNLRRWLDRRAGSPGVITSFFLFRRSVIFSNACAAHASALAGASDKERHRSEEEGSSFTFVIAHAASVLFTFVIAHAASVLIMFDQGAPRSKDTRRWSCTFPETAQGHCSESHILVFSISVRCCSLIKLETFQSCLLDVLLSR